MNMKNTLSHEVKNVDSSWVAMKICPINPKNMDIHNLLPLSKCFMLCQ